MDSKEATRILLKRIPEFAGARFVDSSYMSHELGLPYIVYGDFGMFLRDRLSGTARTSQDDLVLRSSFELLSEMLTSGNPEIVNLAEVGVFETLADTPDLIVAAKYYLTEDAKIVLDAWLEKWLGWLRGEIVSKVVEKG